MRIVAGNLLNFIIFCADSIQRQSDGFQYFRSVATFTAATYEKGRYKRTKEFRQI